MRRATKSWSRPAAIGIFSRVRRAVATLALILIAGLAGNAIAAPVEHREPGKRDATDSIKLAPIVVPIIGADRIVGQAGVLVQLELADPGYFDAVDKARGRLVDAFFRELYVLFDQLQGAPGDVAAAVIKEHLTRVADRVLGPGKLRDIVILGNYERRAPS
jgi:hypothetical protein